VELVALRDDWLDGWLAVCGQDGYTPLAVAVQQGHERVIGALVDTGRPETVNGAGDVGTWGTLTSRGGGGGGGTGGRSSQRSPPALHVAARKDDVAGATTLLQNVVGSGQPAEVRCCFTVPLPTHTHLFNGPLSRDYPGEPVRER